MSQACWSKQEEATLPNPFIDGETEAQGKKGQSRVTQLGNQDEPS